MDCTHDRCEDARPKSSNKTRVSRPLESSRFPIHFIASPSSLPQPYAEDVRLPHVAQLRYGADLRQECIRIQNLPRLDCHAVLKKMNMRTCGTHQLSRRSDAKEFSFMRAEEHETVHYLFAIGDDVINFGAHVGKALKQG